MNWNTWIRQSHRWLSILFTGIVIGIFITIGIGKQPAPWVYYLPLPPLFLMLLSGLYLFVLPYSAKRLGGQHLEGKL
jgi:hypothetical protein